MVAPGLPGAPQDEAGLTRKFVLNYYCSHHLLFLNLHWSHLSLLFIFCLDLFHSNFFFFFFYGNLLQYSCLENPINKGTLRVTVHEVTGGWVALFKDCGRWQFSLCHMRHQGHICCCHSCPQEVRSQEFVRGKLLTSLLPTFHCEGNTEGPGTASSEPLLPS